MHLNDLLTHAVRSGASDLHIKVGSHPMMRVDGTLVTASEEHRLEREDTETMAATVLTVEQRKHFVAHQEIDVAYSIAGLGRFRCNIFTQRGSISLVIRVIPTQVPSIEGLDLPSVLGRISNEERGLVLVTGTTGSGKSTTLAAMLNHINQTRAAHMVTVEQGRVQARGSEHLDDRRHLARRDAAGRGRGQRAAGCVPVRRVVRFMLHASCFGLDASFPACRRTLSRCPGSRRRLPPTRTRGRLRRSGGGN